MGDRDAAPLLNGVLALSVYVYSSECYLYRQGGIDYGTLSCRAPSGLISRQHCLCHSVGLHHDSSVYMAVLDEYINGFLIFEFITSQVLEVYLSVKTLLQNTRG